MAPIAQQGADVHYLGLVETAELIRRRELSSEEVTAALLKRVDRLEPQLHSFALVLEEAAMEQARAADKEIAAGLWRGPLHGAPIGVKDLLDMAGLPTAAGCDLLRDNVAATDATVVRKLKHAGAVIIGKLHTTEGALLDHHPSIPRPVNPWSAEHWTGVSSSGSGVATAAGLCYGALGTDTGGSIRMPSSANNLTAIKPTWGRVSRHGLFPLAESLDHIGPMARSARDAAAMLQVIAGADPRDPTALVEPRPDDVGEFGKTIADVIVGVDWRFAAEGLPAEIEGALKELCRVLQDLGADVRPVRTPWDPDTDNGALAILVAELAQAHAAFFPSQAERYGARTRATIEAGRAVDAAGYIQASRLRAQFNGQLAKVFQEVNLLVTPGLGLPVPRLTELEAILADLEVARRTLMRFTSPFNLSGLPTLSLPGGFTSDGLPLGLQLVGGRLSEALLCRVGHAVQQITDHHLRHPPLT